MKFALSSLLLSQLRRRPKYRNFVCQWLVVTLPILTAVAGTAPPPNARQHWAFQPLRLVSSPAVKDKRWAKTDVDRFILAKLESAGAAPASTTDPRTLIRRMTFDLAGLPPTPQE